MAEGEVGLATDSHENDGQGDGFGDAKGRSSPIPEFPILMPENRLGDEAQSHVESSG